MKQMKSCAVVAAGVLACASLVGCVSAPFQPPNGLISVIKAPLSTEGRCRTGERSGSSSSKCVLGLYAWGDCSVTAAAKDGGLSHVEYLDYSYLNVIGIWQEVKVTAYGD